MSQALANAQTAEAAQLDISGPTDGVLVLQPRGSWTVYNRLPQIETIEKRIDASPAVRKIAFDGGALEQWDSGLLTFVIGLIKYAKAKQIDVDLASLPRGVHGLIELASAVAPAKDAARGRDDHGFLHLIGIQAIEFAEGTGKLMSFIGEAALSFGRLITGRARYRKSDLWLFIEQAGADALPIISLLSVLQGLSMAFLGAAQLQMFGAQIFVANLIGLSFAAEVGSVMTAIIMAGRTGAGYAAQIGTMQVNQEIDALKTLGLVPMDYLVLPRMLALIIMMPMLYLYSNLLGMFGGGLIAVNVLDLTTTQFLNQLFGAVPLSIFFNGLIKSAVFGFLVAMCSCMRGIECGRSAAAVGNATTSAVVSSIVSVIVASGVFGVLFPPLSVGN